MRDLNLYAEYCMELLNEIGIKYGNVVEWKVNTRAKKRWGQTELLPSGNFKIEINSILLDERNDEKGLESTIIHELLHTVDGCYNHGKEWKRLANKVSIIYGYQITTSSTAQEKGIVVGYEPQERIIKYKIRCKKCGYVFNRQRKSEFVEHYFCYKHSYCGGGEFERIL